MVKKQQKSHIRHRCPWCGCENGKGERYRKIFFIKLDNIFWLNCKNCGNYFVKKQSWRYNFIYFMVVVLIAPFFLEIPVISGIIIFVIADFMAGLDLPYIRISRGKWYERVYPYPKPKSVKAVFCWLSKKENGIPFINYRVKEDTILPICFVDKSNHPISQIWCVVFENIKRKGKYKMEAEIHLLLEEAPEELLETGNQFVVFGHEDKIGIGQVV